MSVRGDLSPAGGAPGAGADRIACYVGLVRRFHATLDLVSDRALDRIDALVDDAKAYAAALERHAPPGTVLDLGSGAGLPGAVVASLLPELAMVWVERRRRRATFLRMVAATCRLQRVRVLERDVRDVTIRDLDGPVVAVTAQAVGDFGRLIGLTRHLVRSDAILVARRESSWDAERAAAELPGGLEVVEAVPLGGGGTLAVVRMLGGE